VVFGACFNDIAHKNATISLEHAAALATLRVGRFNQKQGEKRQGPELGYPSLGTANVALHRCAVRRALELGINVRPDLLCLAPAMDDTGERPCGLGSEAGLAAMKARNALQRAVGQEKAIGAFVAAKGADADAASIAAQFAAATAAAVESSNGDRAGLARHLVELAASAGAALLALPSPAPFALGTTPAESQGSALRVACAAEPCPSATGPSALPQRLHPPVFHAPAHADSAAADADAVAAADAAADADDDLPIASAPNCALPSGMNEGTEEEEEDAGGFAVLDLSQVCGPQKADHLPADAASRLSAASAPPPPAESALAVAATPAAAWRSSFSLPLLAAAGGQRSAGQPWRAAGAPIAAAAQAAAAAAQQERLVGFRAELSPEFLSGGLHRAHATMDISPGADRGWSSALRAQEAPPPDNGVFAAAAASQVFSLSLLLCRSLLCVGCVRISASPLPYRLILVSFPCRQAMEAFATCTSQCTRSSGLGHHLPVLLPLLRLPPLPLPLDWAPTPL